MGTDLFFARGSSLPHDARIAVRSLLKTPGLTFVVVLTLAVAIGATTAIFSVVESVLLKPLPYPDEARIVRVAATVHAREGERGDRGNAFSDRGYWHFANNNRSFAKFGAYAGPLSVAFVGRAIAIDGAQTEVIGVMPAHFGFPGPEVDLWVPFRLDPASTNFGGHYLAAVARLAPGVTLESATEDARGLVARFGEIGYGPSWFEGVFDGGAVVRPFRDFVAGDAREPPLLVLGTVGFVLLIACSNVANLLLVRADARRRENAVRLALGGTRGRLARHVLIESLLLAFAGGVAGVVLANVGTRVLVAVGPAGIPRLGEIEVSGAALAFTAAVSTLAALLFGVLPALRSGSAQTIAALRDGGRSVTLGLDRHRARNVLVTTQVALAFVLVIGCGLMVRSFDALRGVDPGFAVDEVLTFAVRPPLSKYEGPDAIAQFYDRILERLEAVPGVERVGAIDALPLTGRGRTLATRIAEFPPAEGEFPPVFQIRRTAPGFFEAMRIPLVEGRLLVADDHDRRLDSAVISRSIKETYWPNTSALGKRLNVSGVDLQVVGVVDDTRFTSLDAPVDRLVYTPIVDPTGNGRVEGMTLTVRGTIAPLRLVAPIRSALAELDPELAIADVRPMARVVGDSISRTSFTAAVLTIAAAVAMFLGAVGIYGVLSYIVSQRTTEIAIRSALGATPTSVRRMVLAQGMAFVGIGVLLGFGASLALARLIAAQLYGVGPVDPLVLVGAAALFAVVALLASLVPAARAAGTAPVNALRIG